MVAGEWRFSRLILHGLDCRQASLKLALPVYRMFAAEDLCSQQVCVNGSGNGVQWHQRAA